ncbi:MAG: AraC family transcriptional regulator [Acutalibacteraceae bacterium]|nr:AraC family transcriptional regulator [Acutalibacteraceae bacterium]
MNKEINAIEEIVDNDDFGLPIRYYNFSSSNPEDMTMFAHWHNEVEIMVFTKGTCLNTIDNTEVYMNENDILFVPSQSIHYGQSTSKEIEVHTLVFPIDVLCPQSRSSSVMKYFTPFINRTAQIPYIIRTTDKGYDDLFFAIKTLIDIIKNKPPCFELQIINWLTKYFIELYTNGYVNTKPHNAIADKNYIAVRDAIKYIENNYSQQLSVEDLAYNAGFSKSRFMSIFKEYTNTTCKKYINQYRLDQSQAMLRDTNNTVLNIAISCGYNNISLYNREFKKVYGITPLEYRKNYR